MVAIAEPLRIALAAGSDSAIWPKIFVNDSYGTTVGADVAYNVAEGARWLAGGSRRRVLGTGFDVADQLSAGYPLLYPEFGIETAQRFGTDGLLVCTGRWHMTFSDEITNLANDYVSGRVTLSDLRRWLNDRLTTYADMPDTDPAAGLWGFVQIRVWEHDKDALSEQDLRAELREHLAAEGLLTSAAARRAV